VDEYVGLIYPSDYGYAVKEEECREVIMYNYKDTGTPVCKNNNWLFSGSHYWTISPSSKYSTYALYVAATGYVAFFVIDFEAGVRESLYLAPETKFSGSGKSNDKFYAFLWYGQFMISLGETLAHKTKKCARISSKLIF